MLRIYNSLNRRKEELRPITPGKIGMYVCGMTVYDYCHVGHARVMVVFDTVVRYLRNRGLEVTYVRNITDIDDKIIKRALENGEDFKVLTERFIQAMHEDEEALHVVRPDQEPRATDTMERIIAMVETLVKKGVAYVAESGDVYYDVSGFRNYGQLSGKDIADLRSGARVAIDGAKDDPLDFSLWKASKPGEPSWGSPWGPGRPGWHIECSAMSTGCLGNHFDIHGGGMDLQFPHHENEIAQSEGVTGEHFVNLWMHNGFVRVDDEKMSKSLGNFFTVREVLERYTGEVLRYFILSSHYRSPLNYSDVQLETAKAGLERLYTAMRGLPESSFEPDGDYVVRFNQAMEDDFNTPEAMAVLFELAKEVNREREDDIQQAARLGGTLKYLGGVLGMLQEDAELFLQGAGAGVTVSGPETAWIEEMITSRAEARAARNWAEADRIRDELTEQGVILEDGPDGTVWRRG